MMIGAKSRTRVLAHSLFGCAVLRSVRRQDHDRAAAPLPRVGIASAGGLLFARARRCLVLERALVLPNNRGRNLGQEPSPNLASSAPDVKVDTARGRSLVPGERMRAFSLSARPRARS
jgi:hypothetical protein